MAAEPSLTALVHFFLQAFQVGMDIVIAVIFRQVDQHSCGTAPLSGSAKAAVADPSAWRAEPLRIKQSIANLLSVSITETWAAELTPDPYALFITAAGLGIDRLLATLVASCSHRLAVDLCPHVVADSVQLGLGDVLHWTHHMWDG